MKLNVLVFGLLISLSGCATTQDFFSITPTPTNLAGTWTGQYEQLVATLILKNDGTGQICQDHIGTARLISVKTLNDRLYSQDGSYWKIVPLNQNNFKLNYAIGGGFNMLSDNNQTLVSPACREKLKLIPQ